MLTTLPITLPPFQLPAKPKYGALCNGCGWCCHSEVCSIGKRFFNIDIAPCLGMVFEEGKVRCGVVQAEARLGGDTGIAQALGIGKGCDSADPDGYPWVIK